MNSRFEAFRKYKKPSSNMQDKFLYFKIEEYMERLDEAFGVDGYNIDCSMPELISLGEQTLCTVKVTLSILKEDGTYVSRSSLGMKEYLPNKDGKAFLDTLGSNAVKAGIKECCKAFGIFGSAFDEINSSRGKKKTASGTNSSNSNTSIETSKFSLNGCATTEESGSGLIYNIPVIELNTGESAIMRFYPNQISSCEDNFKTLLLYANSGKNSTFSAKFSRSKSLIFKGFV